MSYSINRRPLLWGTSDSEFEGDLETEVDDPHTVISDEKPFLKPYEPHDKYVSAHIEFNLELFINLYVYCIILSICVFFCIFHTGIILHILYFIYLV